MSTQKLYLPRSIAINVRGGALKKNTRVARSAQSTGVPSMCLAEPSPTGLRLPARCLAERLKKKVRVNVFRGAVTNRLAINVPG